MFHVKHIANEYDIIYNILLDVISGKNLNESFNKNIKESEANISKIKDISYGVMRNYFILKSILENLAKTKPQQDIYILLLIAIYEIKFTKKPAYAVTNDIVEQSYKLTKSIQIKNFVNAVIRNFIRTQNDLKNTLSNNQEFKYNLPFWIIHKLKKDYRENWKSIIENSNQKPKIALRINSTKTSLDKYMLHLETENVKYKLVNNIIILENTLAVEKIPFFAEGYVSIQDINAQKLVEIIKFKPNEYILDACSAPGGKACQILESNKVRLLALDIDKLRLDKVEQNLNRLNLKANIVCGDAASLLWWDNNKFDTIIADVPCSATGTLKRNPDIKIHREISDINKFVSTQRKIILNLWKTLKNNGQMLYITCSIFKEENQENIKFFEQELKDLKVLDEIQFWPTKDSDGFYYCLLEKMSN